MEDEILDEWTVKANNVMSISLVTKTGEGFPKTIHSFQPAWTYPIVGRDPDDTRETIYGYKDLKINLRFNASDMRPHLSHTSAKRVPVTVATDESPDINPLFEPFLPPVAFGKRAHFDTAVANTSDDWHPPGELIETTDGDKDGHYEVWKGSLADPLVLALVKRIQILVSLFIEGGTPIQTESSEKYEADPLDRWTIFFLYQKRPRAEDSSKFSYVFVGYATVYRFFIFRPQSLTNEPAKSLELPKDTTPFSEFPCRSRISQFLILPPFQHKGNGQRLYKPIYQTWLNDSATFEITVEDPNEAFDAMRDMADLAFLREQPDFNEININTKVALSKIKSVPGDIIDSKAMEAVRLKYKIASRQFFRLVEMHLMSKLSPSVVPEMNQDQDLTGKGKQRPTREEEHVYRLWRLLAKSRIAVQNKEQLSAIEPHERIDRLDETLNSVELEYALLLSMFKSKTTGSRSSEKRKLEDDEDAETSASKRSKV
ncbi:histone acetyltransferase type B catalytic subunit [Coniella lustricola]|uniref:Histone acetyltransferase type B catalytic subunit n=1 Tax=Coniella lustricola TaxID=2025994 RepID=A0A2T3AFI6_9PEZI|nr:histone acetyltransferase type B catalytic subunit [Coniella lustricola]